LAKAAELLALELIRQAKRVWAPLSQGVGAIAGWYMACGGAPGRPAKPAGGRGNCVSRLLGSVPRGGSRTMGRRWRRKCLAKEGTRGFR